MTVTAIEPRVSVPEFAKLLDMSPRWVEARITEGMPSERIGRRRKIKPLEAEAWLEAEGHIRRAA